MTDSLFFNPLAFHNALAEHRRRLASAHADLNTLLTQALETIEPDDPLRKSVKKLSRSLASSYKQLNLTIAQHQSSHLFPPPPN